MAEDQDQQQNPFGEEADGEDVAGSPAKIGLILRVGLMVLVLSAGSAAGYAVGGLFHRAPQPIDPNAAPAEEPVLEPPTVDIANEEFAYIDFERITVNMREPQLARYIAATITLAIRKKNEEAATKIIEQKKKELRNWLTTYLADRTPDDVRGAKGLNTIRREITDAFNEQLWPNSQPLINHVLFKEFAVQ